MDFSLNRCYDAIYYAASAVLLSRGHRFTKHSGVRAGVHRHLVKPGQLSRELGELYDRLFEDRQQADYVALVSFDSEEVGALLPKGAEFLTALEALIAAEPSE